MSSGLLLGSLYLLIRFIFMQNQVAQIIIGMAQVMYHFSALSIVLI